MTTIERVPAYAWDWVSRQRLVWREARTRLAGSSEPTGARYRALGGRFEVLAALRADFPDDAVVRHVISDVIRDVVFLGHTDRPFADLQVTNAPRGMRWWWRQLTDEDLDAGPPPTVLPPHQQLQLSEVLRGYGDE